MSGLSSVAGLSYGTGLWRNRVGLWGGAAGLINGSGSSPTTVIKGVVCYGQSLDLGTDPNGSAVVTTAPVTGQRMFNGGIRPVYDRTGVTNVNDTIWPAQITSLATLQSALSAFDPANIGETFCPGMGLRMTSAGLFSATGRGGFTIEALSRTAANHFPNTVAVVNQARDLCDAAGYSYVPALVDFKHGEANAVIGTTKAAYKALEITLRQDLENHFNFNNRASVGTLKMMIDQQAFGGSTGTWADIAVSAIELHRAGGGFYCVGPTYPWTFTANNDVHMTEVTYRNYGEKRGLVAQKLIDGTGWNPCYITSTPTRVGATITVPIYVPSPPLVFDTTLVAAVASMGFTWSAGAILSVTITDDGTGDNAGVITIVVASAAGGTLGVAYNNNVTPDRIGPIEGPRTNIRDSDSAVTLYDGTKLYNWLCNDQWVVA
jgi:hypothetical protein